MQLLTLVPGSWSIGATLECFSTSERSVKRARGVKKFCRILAEPTKREGRSICDDIKAKVCEVIFLMHIHACAQGRRNMFQ